MACKVAEGNQRMIARALGINRSAVQNRIARDPQLNALYGDMAPNGDSPVPPREADVLLRQPSDFPLVPSNPELGEMVKETEKLVRDGLSTLGVPAATIAKLKSFDGLAVGAGAFLAQSLQDTHQIYYIKLMQLDAMADDIKRRYLDEGAPEAPPPLERMFWQRAYNECIEQLGKGHDRMLSGTQAMVAMMKAKGKQSEIGGRAKPGW